MQLRLIRAWIAVAVVCAGIGLLAGPSAQASPATRVASAGRVAGPSPDTSTGINLSVSGGCGTWKGTLTAYTSAVGKYYENYVEVTGTISAGCNGQSVGRLYYLCASSTYRVIMSWTVDEASTGTDYTAGPCSTGVAAYAELCWTGPSGGGCASSGAVSAVVSKQTAET